MFLFNFNNLDIKSWFNRNSEISHLDGADNADLERFQKATGLALPNSLKIILLEVNGNVSKKLNKYVILFIDY